jgi:hypothetical protein
MLPSGKAGRPFRIHRLRCELPKNFIALDCHRHRFDFGPLRNCKANFIRASRDCRAAPLGFTRVLGSGVAASRGFYRLLLATPIRRNDARIERGVERV